MKSKTNVSVEVPSVMDERLKEIAEKRMTSKSAVIREIVAMYLESHHPYFPPAAPAPVAEELVTSEG
jgi:predicted DNA-binding protein